MTLDYMADYMAIICLNEHESIESNEWRGQESLPSARKAAIIYLKGVDNLTENHRRIKKSF